MKKIISLLLCLCFLVAMLGGCGNSAETAEKFTVVTTIFPVYDWVKNIVGDNADVRVVQLLDDGTDLHNFKPSAGDLKTLSSCDVFIYVGGESDEWVSDALASAENKNLEEVNLLELLGSRAKIEEALPGMQKEEGEEEAADEHIWLSLKNAAFLSEKIADILSQKLNLDFKQNAQAYAQKLTEMDEEFEKAIGENPEKPIIIADRFPFRYFADDYNLKCFAAFSGCSAETEVSFKTVSFLSEQFKNSCSKYILVLEGSDKKIAKTVLEDAGSPDAQILSLNSMQAITAADVKAGAEYIKIMEENISTFKKVISGE